MEVRVVRGRADGPATDREVTAAMLERTAATAIPSVRVWRPHKQVAFGRRDANADGYGEARQVATDRGFRPVERGVGGRAVAYTGRTLAFAHAVPIDDVRRNMNERYERVTETLVETLRSCGADVVRGEPTASYCPGSHSISAADADGEPAAKLAGIAQRIRSGAALVSGCLTVADADESEIRAVLTPIYEAIAVPFSATSVGSVSRAGGPTDPETVRRLVETSLIAGRNQSVVHASELVIDHK